MAITYEPIASTTLGSATASVTFSSLGSYTDIVLVCSVQSASSGDARINIRFNGDTASNYSGTFMYGDGSAAGSGRNTSRTSIDGTGVTVPESGTSFAPYIYQIMNYSNSSTYKTVLCRGNNTTAQVGQQIWAGASVSLWRSTSAITSIVILDITGRNFNTGSTFTLYGIASA